MTSYELILGVYEGANMLEKVVAVDKGGIEDVTDIGRPTAKKEATWTSGRRLAPLRPYGGRNRSLTSKM